MPKNRKTYKLSEVTTKIGSGATPRGGKEAYKESGISLIRSQNVLDFKFSVNGLAFIDEAQAAKLKNVIVEENDVLLNITGDSVARVCSVPKEFLPARVNQHVAIIRADNELLDSKFLMYSLLEKSNKDLLLTLGSAGATRNALTKSMIEDFELSLPPLKEQTQIANILSAIDDKIENNLATNKTLEEMAMALYKHWFVDFGPFQDGEFIDSELGLIPKGWEVKPFLDMFELLSGGTPKTSIKEYWNGEINWVSAKDIGSSGSIYINNTEKKITQFGVDKSATKVLPEDTVIVVARGSVGKFGMITKPMCMNQSCYGIYSKSDYSQSVTYLLIDSLMKHFLNVAYGSVFDTITTSTFKSISVLEPPNRVMDKVKEEIDVLFQQKKMNINENQTLTKLRDTLLPKLISGEVRLKEFR
jgi:type I restriction enzyme S subunit